MTVGFGGNRMQPLPSARGTNQLVVRSAAEVRGIWVEQAGFATFVHLFRQSLLALVFKSLGADMVIRLHLSVVLPESLRLG